MTKPKSSFSPVFIAAILAVGLWAFTPIVITFAGNSLGYTETYIIAAVLSTLSSIVLFLVFHKQTRALLKDKKLLLKAAGWAALSGVFLGLWYYGYYRALHSAPKTDVTVIAFTWPLISILAIRWITPATAKPLKLGQWILILLSFLGAAAIAFSNVQATDTGERNIEIIWAVIAAIGSGMYLPFAIKSSHHLNKLIPSSVYSTMYSISILNFFSLLFVSIMTVGVMGERLDFSSISLSAILLCALTGIGTYLIAEIAWTWAIQSYNSLTIATLPYFTPAASVILIFLFFGETIKPIAIIGLLLILVSNLVLHLRKDKPREPSITGEIQVVDAL